MLSKIKKLFVLIGFFTFLLFQSSVSFGSDNLKKYLIQFIDSKNYPYHLLDDNYKVYYQQGELILGLNKDELKSLYDEQNKMIEENETKNFKILGRIDTKSFTSVTYEYDYSMIAGNMKISGKMVSHSILKKTGNTWKTIFETASQ